MSYRNGIPPEVRLVYHIGIIRRVLSTLGFVRYIRRMTFVELELSLYEWYDSLGSSKRDAIQGDGELRRLVENYLDKISERQQHVVRLRYGFDNGRVKTLKEVGITMGIVSEAVRRIESKALNRLKYPSRTQEIRGYLKKTASDIIR